MWSYSGDPDLSTLDAVRFEVQDTNSRRPLLSDEEIERAVTLEAPGSPPSQAEVWGAAALCMEALARLFSMQADTETGALRVVYSKQAENYAKMAQDMRSKSSGAHAPIATGTTVSERESKLQSLELIQPAFRKSMFKNPRGGSGRFEGGLIESTEGL